MNPRLHYYIYSLLITSAAISVQVALRPLVETIAFIFFYPVVLLTSYRFGLGPSFLSLILLVASYFFYFSRFEEGGDFGFPQAMRMAVFTLCGGTIAYFITKARNATSEIAKSSQDLAFERAKLAAIIEQMPAAVWVAEAPSGKLMLGNALSRTLMKQPKKPAKDLEEYGGYIGYRNGERIRSLDWPLARAISKGEVVHNDILTLEKEDGSRIWARFDAAPLRDSENRIVGGVVIGTDITEQKRSQELILENENRIKNATEATGIGIWEIDLDTSEVWRSPSHDAVYGFNYDPHRPVDFFFSRYLPEDRKRAEEDMSNAIKKTKIWSGTYRLSWPDQSVHWVEINGRVVKNNTTNTQRLIGTIQDITERKRNMELLKSIVDHSPLPIVVHDQRGIVKLWNNESERLFQWKAEEVLGRPIPHVPSQRMHEVQSNLSRTLSGEVIARLETVRVRKDGSPVDVLLSASSLFNGEDIVVMFSDITQTKKAEELRRNSEKLLIDIIDNSPSVIFIKDKEGRHVLINKRFETLFNVNRENIIGKTDQDLLPPDIAIQFNENDRKVWATQRPITAEEEVRTENGSHTFMTLKFPLLDEGGRPYALAGIATDITERKNFEEMLKASQAAMEAFFASSPGILNLFDEESHYLQTDPNTPSLLGLNRETIKGKLARDLNPHFHEVFFAPVMEQIKRTGKPLLNIETSGPIPGRNREIGFFRVSCFPVPLPGGKQGLGTMGVEITKEKIAEEALKASEQKYRLMVESVPHLKWSCHPDGTVAFFNQRWSEYTGVSNEELLTSNWLDWIHPEDFEKASKLRANPRKWGEDFEIDVRLKHHSGEYFWHKVKVVSLKNEQGEILAWYGTAVNINTEIRAAEILEKKVQERTQELEATNRELETFSYSVSHDLRAPLRSINGFSKRLVRKLPNMNKEALEDLERIQEASRRMGHLIDDLLQLSRISRSELHRGMINVSEMSREIISELKNGDKLERDVQVIIPEKMMIYGDSGLLRQAMQNLLGNAWKFTRNTPRPVIELKYGETKSDSVITIKDNGAGFDMDFSHQLFGAFQRLHSSEDYEGTGIGLATVRRIITKHGGEVWGKGIPGKGAEFTFRIPRPVIKERDYGPREERPPLN